MVSFYETLKLSNELNQIQNQTTEGLSHRFNQIFKKSLSVLNHRGFKNFIKHDVNKNQNNFYRVQVQESLGHTLGW